MRISIIGSGPASIGVLAAVEYINNELKVNQHIGISHFTDSGKNLIKHKESNQINRNIGIFGTSKYWHGVSFFHNISDQLNYLIKYFYGFQNIDSIECNKLFIPRTPPLTKNIFKKFKTFTFQNTQKIKYNTYDSKVISIEKLHDNTFKIRTSEDTIYSDYVFICTSLWDLNKIKCIKHNIHIDKYYEHDIINLGIANKNDIKPLELSNIQYNKKGYYLNFINYKEFILTIRPFYRNQNEINIKNFQNFGKTKSEIIFDSIVHGKFGGIIEGLSTKYGILYNTKLYSVWIQKRIEIKNEKELLNKGNQYITENELSQYKKIISHDIKLSKDIGIKIPGTHLFSYNKYSHHNSNIFIAPLISEKYVKHNHNTLYNAFNLFMKLLSITKND